MTVQNGKDGQKPSIFPCSRSIVWESGYYGFDLSAIVSLNSGLSKHPYANLSKNASMMLRPVSAPLKLFRLARATAELLLGASLSNVYRLSILSGAKSQRPFPFDVVRKDCEDMRLG